MDQPKIIRRPNGTIKAIIYQLPDGRAHRIGGPALQYWHTNGTLVVEKWYQHGILHRDCGPAWLYWSYAGELVEEGWYYYGHPHREGGPAVRIWNTHAELINEKWYLCGEKISEEKFNNAMRMKREIAGVLRELLPQPIFEEIVEHFRVVFPAV